MGANPSTAFVASTPSFTVAGNDQAELSRELLDLAIREDTLGLYRCEARFGNWGSVNGSVGFRYFDRALLDFGAAFQVKVRDTVLFDGRIMGLSASYAEDGEATLLVLADDRLQDLRMTRRTRAFADVSDADVMRRIASDHGLTPQIDVPGPTHRVLAQVNQSDLAFLRDRAHAVDAEVWVEGSTLHAQRRGSRGGTPIDLGFRNQLRALTVTADLAGQRTEVSVSGWDVAAKSAINARATSSALAAELGSDASGVSILQGIAGRKENLAHTAPATTAEAQAMADAFYRIGARRFVTGHGVASTASGLKVGTLVNLTDVGPLFSGRYMVTAVCHRFDLVQGIRTEFDVERPGIGQPGR